MAATLEFVRSVHHAMHQVAAPYLGQLNTIAQQEERLKVQKSLLNLEPLSAINDAITQHEERLKLQKSLIRATAAAELTKVGAQLKLSSETLAKATALMLTETAGLTANGEYHLHTEFRKMIEQDN
jgi:hypothetical protein